LPVRLETDDEDEEFNGTCDDWESQKSTKMSPAIGRSMSLSDIMAPAYQNALTGKIRNFLRSSSLGDKPKKRKSNQRRIMEDSDQSDTTEDATMDSAFESD